MRARDFVFAAVAVVLIISLISSLNAYLKLELENQSLREAHAQLEAEYRDLLENHTALANNYRELDKEFSSLSLEYQRLKDGYQDLESRYLRLNASYSLLVRSHEDLRMKYAELENNHSILVHKLSSLESMLEAMSLRVRISGEVFKLVLNRSRDEEISEIIHRRLNLDSASPPSIKATKIFEWIALNMQYVRDQYHPYYSDGVIDYAEEYLEPVNETLSLGGGDCEDLAVLTYFMLRDILGEGEEIYLIVLENIEIRHVAVLYKSGGLFLIMDPAGSYINDAIVVLEVLMLQTTTRELMRANLIPIKLSPSLKSWLINEGFAELRYVEPGVLSPATPGRFSDIEETINSWVDYWGEDMPGAYVSMIANETYTRSFSSTSEFINWIRKQG